MIVCARLRTPVGLTLLELLIGMFITAVVATAGFQFYARYHHLGEAQSDISELQNLGRNSLREIQKSLRLAGFDLTGHLPYEIKGDTLAVYYSQTQAVDTILYYLEEFKSTEYALVPSRPTDMHIYNLMKKTNSALPVMFADYVSAVSFVPIDLRNMAVTVTVQADRRDDRYVPNDGFRTYQVGGRVLMRNAK